MVDFEDALQYFSALHAGAACIPTRSAGDFPAEPTGPVFSPTEFLADMETQ